VERLQAAHPLEELQSEAALVASCQDQQPLEVQVVQLAVAVAEELNA
tara:strand:+ start:3240 stop:3380 length:141 start_codon:yes stop_codon:yes gene_type:complete